LPILNHDNTSLKVLFLRANKITEIPKSFNNLRYLTELYIMETGIKNIPNEIIEGENLRLIAYSPKQLGDNQIKEYKLLNSKCEFDDSKVYIEPQD
ncbi:hypothetical protein, partial [Chryseobacterium joostei]